MKFSKLFSFIAVVLLVTIVFAGLVTIPTAAVAGSTEAMYRYNAQRTGDYTPVAGSTLPNNQLKWVAAAYADTDPIVSGDTLYVGGSANGLGGLVAINTANGALKWVFETLNPVQSTPAISNGLIFFGCYNDTFYAIYENNGRKNGSSTLTGLY